MNTRARHFIRHPCSIPIRIEAAAQMRKDAVVGKSRNISKGGVCCLSDVPYEKGDCLSLSIDSLEPSFQTVARVMWCKALSDDQYELGVSFFSDREAFAARMVEQVCHIEAYRQQVEAEEGRRLSFDAAAAEWISGFARDFPSGGNH